MAIVHPFQSDSWKATRIPEFEMIKGPSIYGYLFIFDTLCERNVTMSI